MKKLRGGGIMVKGLAGISNFKKIVSKETIFDCYMIGGAQLTRF